MLKCPWRGGAFLCAFVLFAGVAYGLLRGPLQVTDCLEEILEAQRSPGAWSTFTDSFGTSYLRPLRLAETKLIFDAAAGHYWAAYKGFQLALLLAAFMLLVHACRVNNRIDFAAAVFALTVFTGTHTFLGLVKEAYPINHYLQVVVLSLIALTLARGRTRWWTGPVAVGTLIAACLTLESGVVVWAIFVVSYLAGWRGVTLASIAVSTVTLGAYLWLRFSVLATGLVSMGSSQGYLLEVLEPADVQERFGGQMIGFYIYNVVSSALSVLLTEPRGGLWIFTRSWLAGDVPPRLWIGIVTALATTGIVVLAAVHYLRSAKGRVLNDDNARLLLVFAVVLAANAAASFAYAKDQIVTIAGTFYALAAYAGVRYVLTSAGNRARALVLASLIGIAACGWAVRTMGVHHALRTQAFNHRNDWAMVAEWLEARGEWPSEPRGQALVRQLQAEALSMPVTNPWFMERWADRVFEADY